MSTSIRRPMRASALGLLPALLAAPALAGIPEPDNLIYGTVTLAGAPLTAADTDFVVELRLGGSVLDRYALGEDATLGDRYLLRLPIDAIGSAAEDKAQPGDSVVIRYQWKGLTGDAARVTVAERGRAIARDLVIDGTIGGDDADGDGLPDAVDNCPEVFNTDQADMDEDGLGNACDPDLDGDGVFNELDAFPADPREWLDLDGDGIGNNADPDDDGDGVLDDEDNCRTVFNPDQADTDGDGVGDVCSGDRCEALAIEIDAAVFPPGEHSLASEVGILMHRQIEVQSGATLTLRAPAIGLGPSFRVVAGGALRVTPEAVTCTQSEAQMLADEGSDSPVTAAVGDPKPLVAAVPVHGAAALSDAARTRLARLGVDLEGLDDALLDPDGWWLLFASTLDLDAADRNGVSDIYRLDLATEALTLISRTPAGTAGDGPSRYVAADALGDWVVFQSEASDLVGGDDNGVSDIFLHEVRLGLTSRLTGASQPSAHPALDAAGTSLLYDQRGEEGARRILIDAPMDALPAEVVSLSWDSAGAVLDNHHPAISADGRFVAYLEVGAEAAPEACQVHFYDRDGLREQRRRCPAELADAVETARPAFSADGAQVEWRVPDAGAAILVPNPLVEAASEDGG